MPAEAASGRKPYAKAAQITPKHWKLIEMLFHAF